MLAKEEYEKQLRDWIPTEADRAFVHSLMQKVTEPGKMAGLDRAARSRHQQPAGGVRVRQASLIKS